MDATMPRMLPWLAEAATKKETKHRVSSSSSATKRKRASSPDDLVDSELNDTRSVTPPRKQKRRPDRTPSTSPPPAPPDVEYMREGYNADDIYMMVEDEFLSTAKGFTQHIHHAEYVRLKKLARSRGAGVLHNISRGVDGRTEQSKSLQLRLEAEEKARKMKSGLKKANDEDDSSEEEDAYMADPQLAGLMTSEKLVGTNLSDLTKARSNTRAAAGFSQSPRNVERTRDALAERPNVNEKPTASSSKINRALRHDVSSEDEDDSLDTAPVQPRRPNAAGIRKRKLARDGEYANPSITRDGKKPEDSGIFKRFAQPPQADRIEAKHGSDGGFERVERKHKSPSPSMQTTTSNNTRPATAIDLFAKRRADREKKEQAERRKVKQKLEVPTFLI